MDAKDALEVEAWPCEKVASWLRSIDLAQHAHRFMEEGVCGATLLCLTADELKTELGVRNFGERKMLLEKVRVLSSQSQCDVQTTPDVPMVSPAEVAPADPPTEITKQITSGQKLLLLDGKNIACEGGCDGHPNAAKLKGAMDWIAANRPGWHVRVFVYRGLVDQWLASVDPVVVFSNEQLVVTLKREDVDKFIIRRAIDAQRVGAVVRIFSNDNFLGYIGQLRDAPEFTHSWVRQHVVKFCFDSNTFVPADGFAHESPIADPWRVSCTDHAENRMQVDSQGSCAAKESKAPSAVHGTERAGLNTCSVQLTGRGAPWPQEFHLVSGETAMTQCPHRRQCHLRVECQVQPGHVWFLQITGLEAPANRAEHHKVRLEGTDEESTWCPTCRGPMTIRKLSPRAAASASMESAMRSVQKNPASPYVIVSTPQDLVPNPTKNAGARCAFVSVLFGPDESVIKKCIVDALVLGYSLRKTKTMHDLVLMHTPDILQIPGANVLEEYWQLEEIEYVQAAPVLTSRSHARFKHVFTKLRALGATRYEKIVLLDLDLLVRENVDELFQLQVPTALRRGHGARSLSPSHGHDFYDRTGRQSYGMNLGVAVLQPSDVELGKILDVLANAHDRMHQATHGPEQDFLTRWPSYVDKWSSLDLKYNYQLHQLRHSLRNEGLEALRLKMEMQDVKILHFSGNIKPRDYFFQEPLGNAQVDFGQFCENVLIPEYGQNGILVEAQGIVHRRLRDAVWQWHSCFNEMWHDLLRTLCNSEVCLLCASCELENRNAIKAEHSFLKCPQIQDVIGIDSGGDSVDVLTPSNPRKFHKTFALVAIVHERRSRMRQTHGEIPSQVEEQFSSCGSSGGVMPQPPDEHLTPQKRKLHHPIHMPTTDAFRETSFGASSVTRELNEDLQADSQRRSLKLPRVVTDDIVDRRQDRQDHYQERGPRRERDMVDGVRANQEIITTDFCQEDVAKIVDLGFSISHARMALQQAQTLEAALNLLFESDSWTSKESSFLCDASMKPSREPQREHVVEGVQTCQQAPRQLHQDVVNAKSSKQGAPHQVSGLDQVSIQSIVELGFSHAQACWALQQEPVVELAVELLVESADKADVSHTHDLNALLDMGFTFDQATAALHGSAGVDAALESLLGHRQPSPLLETSADQLLKTQLANAPMFDSPAGACEPGAQDDRQRPPPFSTVLEPKRGEILGAITRSRVTIIVAPTGCGKSTSIPQMLLDEEADRRILCTQPRRVAATSLARRVAKIRNTPLGAEVGYQIGGCSEITRGGTTKLVYAVTAIAMMQCLQQCSTFTHLIIDEVHIRDTFIDFLLTLVVTRVLRGNKDVRIILMSAAMDSDSLKAYFAKKALDGVQPTVLDLESCRPHRLTESYLEDYSFFQDKGFVRLRADAEWEVNGIRADWSQEEVADLYAEFVVHLHRERDLRLGGHGREYESFLVFLAGRREVTLLAEKINEKRLPNLNVRCLFGGQTVEMQEQALATNLSTKRRTIILATDVVESSVTIPDVDVVIDSCEHKRLCWDPAKRQSPLTLSLISQDEAKQRAGRTARVRPGEVIRLISRTCYSKLRKNAEPQIRHSRLEDVILSIFELPNLGDPKAFLAQMPDPPDPLRVETAITRLFELHALDKSVASDGARRPRPTHFGRFLQKMPVDPEVGCLVMNGVRLRLEAECVILAAVHQRGDPFLDKADWTSAQVKELRAVRDVCSPGRSLGKDVQMLLPSDLVAGMRAYQAWQEQTRKAEAQHAWSIQDEAQWCADHFLSCDRLHEIEEMVVQIHDVLADLGYGSNVTTRSRERMRRWRSEKGMLKGVRTHIGQAGSPRDNLRTLLQPFDNHETKLLLVWCLAASFTAGVIEIRNGSSTEQVKFRPKKSARADDILGHLRENGFSIVHSQTQPRGEVVVSFRNPEEAHCVLQEAALGSSREVPWRSADAWGRPTQHKIEVPRACFGDGKNPPIRVRSSSLAQPVPCDDVTVIVGDILPCMDHKRKSMSYFCSKGSIAPRGILPLVLYATYPATRRSIEEDGLTWRLTAQIHGVVEETRFQAPDPEVARLLDNILKKMDTEFGGAHSERERVRDERRHAVLRLMQRLVQPGPPPMPVHPDDVVLPQRPSRRRRHSQDDFEFEPELRSILRSRDDNDLANFRL